MRPDAAARGTQGRREILDETLSCVEEVLGLSVGDDDRDRALTALGFESFAAVRLRRRIRERTGADVPIAAFLGDASPTTVLAEVERTLREGSDPGPARGGCGAVAPARQNAAVAPGEDPSEVEVPDGFGPAGLTAGAPPGTALLATVGLVVGRWTGARTVLVEAPGSAAVEVPVPDLLTWGGMVAHTARVETLLVRAGSSHGPDTDTTCAVTTSEGTTIRVRVHRRPDQGPLVSWDGAGALVLGARRAHAEVLARLSTDPSCWTDLALCWDPTGAADDPPRPTGAEGPLLTDPLRAAARRGPDRPAVVDQRGTVTHRELETMSAQTATVVRSLGLGRDDQVALACARGVQQIAAAIGIVLGGAAYVPVEPSWPPARIAAVCARAGVRHAFVTPDVVECFPTGIRIHPVEGGEIRDDHTVPDHPRPTRHRATNAAYTIFTSGSTGSPKGVTVEHIAARTTIDEVSHRFQVDESDRVLALSALSFDLSVYDVFGVLGAGGAVVLPDPARGVEPEHWLELIDTEGVTVWNTVPALLGMLVEHAEVFPDESRRALKSLRLTLLSGDWIPVTLPDRLRQLAPQVEIVSLGGATEAAIWSICHPIADVHTDWSSIPYGRALRGQVFYVLDVDRRPCRLGETGELYIGGSGLARGYVGDPEQTTARFATHPVTGRRLYRTGDLGRWVPDGTIEFLGRVDRQVKLNGNRIELGEIESVLNKLPSVGHCVASINRTTDGRQRLIAHIRPRRPDSALDTDKLIGVLRRHLPAYMIPARLVSVTEFPVTANGKIDIGRLPDPFTGGASAAPIR